MAISWEARERLIKAAVGRISADYGDETQADYDAQREYADDALDESARELVAALDAEA